jgi:CRP/FNR family transcriptional regulator, cyclic AMP receptor protein
VKLLTQNTKVDALAKVPLLAGLSKGERAQLAKVAEELDVPAGRKLAVEGARGREFFAIVEGQADVTKQGKKIGTLGPGDHCGEFALLIGGPRPTTVTATTPVRMFVLTDRDFKQLLRTNPGVELKVMRSLAEWVRRLRQNDLTL